MAKVITSEQAAAFINDGDIVMFAGFLGVGTPPTIIEALLKKGTKDITGICNDTAFVDSGIGKLIMTKQFKKVIVSHIGTNKETQRQMNEGELEVELNPQGTLAERIRCGGLGMGGFYTPTGVGTPHADGKEVRELEGRDMLFETPLKGKISVLHAAKGDKYGNLRYHATQRNFNDVMAFASDIVIAEVDELVDFMDPDDVHTPGPMVDYIVRRGR